MKNHIAIKFLAVLLCTITLFCSIVSVLGIAVTEREDLYDENVPQRIRELQLQTLSDAINPIISKHLSEVLGGCPTALVEDYYGRYVTDSGMIHNTWGFELRDAEGTVLYSKEPNNLESLRAHDFSTSFHYLVLVESPVPSDSLGTDSFSRTSSNDMPTDTAGDGSDTEPLPDVYGILYWDYEEGCYYDAKVRGAYISGYTVTVYFSDASFAHQRTWDLVEFLWANRYTLFWCLGISLLIFAITAVYLCCAAGRKPGSEEIKAKK